MNLTSHSFGLGSDPTELHANPDGQQRVESTTECSLWLPFAAECYHISKRLEDYILVPVPAIWSSIPNTNGDSVSIQEFLKFNPDHGMQAFKTFRGKPTFIEHANKDITQAKGVILDVFIRPVKNFGGSRYYKLVMLLAYDRSKDPMLVNSILTGENNAYSVGYYYKSYTCSICQRHVGQHERGPGPCEHTVPKKRTYLQEDGRLVYRHCHDIVGFECSSVASPAFISAVGPYVMNPALV